MPLNLLQGSWPIVCLPLPFVGLFAKHFTVLLSLLWDFYSTYWQMFAQIEGGPS